MNHEIRRNIPLFSIGIVMKLTDLTARQIRYYEQHELIAPARTSGNQRLFSLHDIDRLVEIKALLERGVPMDGIKQWIQSNVQTQGDLSDIKEGIVMPRTEKTGQAVERHKELTDMQLHRLLKQQLMTDRRPNRVSMIQGELSRFFINH